MQQKNQVTLMVPDLFAHLNAEVEIPALDNLSLLLSKASIRNIAVKKDRLSHLTYGFDADASDIQSPAALDLYAKTSSVDSWVCYASPVLLQPNRDHLSIVSASDFDFEESEVNALSLEFNDYFKEDGFEFYFKDSKNWFCLSTSEFEVSDCSPEHIIGENIVQYLPSNKSNALWRKLFNEAQMLLHHSKTNQARITAGKKEINSLWFSGGGFLPSGFNSPLGGLYTNDDVAIGMAKLGGVETHPVTQILMEGQLAQNAAHMIYLPFTKNSNELLLVEEICSKLTQLLQKHSLNDVRIVPDYGREFTTTAKDLKKFWRTRKTINAFI